MANLDESRRTTLCITRHSGQAVWVGCARIEVAVANGNQVRVRITAPHDVPIVREELKTRS